MTAFHIVQGGIDNGDWDWIQRTSPSSVSGIWTVPKSALPGDEVAMYIQTIGIVATAELSGAPRLRPNTKNRYGANLTNIRLLREPIALNEIREACPTLAWARYPKSITTPAADVAATLRKAISRLRSTHRTSTARRDQPALARHVFQRLYPNPAVRRSVAAFLVETLRVAASATTAWAVILYDDYIGLDVGPVQLMGLSPGSVWVCAVGTANQALPAGWSDESHRPMVYPASVAVESRQYAVAATAVGGMPRALKTAVLDYVREAGAKRSGLSAWHYAHSEDVISYLESLLRTKLPRPAQRGGSQRIHLHPDESPEEQEYREGARIRVAVNAYERSEEARRACLARWGETCVICGFDFGATYGAFANGFIHVHHLKPLSTVGSEYHVDPVADLRPVCPNCHAAIHIDGECRSIDEMKAIVRRKMSGARHPRATR